MKLIIVTNPRLKLLVIEAQKLAARVRALSTELDKLKKEK